MILRQTYWQYLEVQIPVTTALEQERDGQKNRQLPIKGLARRRQLVAACRWRVRHNESYKLKSETGNTKTDIGL